MVSDLDINDHYAKILKDFVVTKGKSSSMYIMYASKLQ